MELRIDNASCDLADGPIAIPAYECPEFEAVGESRQGRSLRITLPKTARNDTRMGFAGDPHTATRFNAALHRAQVACDGAQLFAGQVRLLEAREDGYVIEIREGGARWAREAARKMFNLLPVQYRKMLVPSVILESWTDQSPVKFLPIHRDEYARQNSSTDLLAAERIMTVDDYHPFLHIATLLETIIGEAGYRIESNFIGSEFFRSLYMSGAYPSRDTSAVRRRMEFVARRKGSVTATADHFGRVSTNPLALFSTVGNLVDTATPQTVDADGEVIEGLCNNGGCFVVEQGKIGFRPPTEVSAGFEYYLKYTTDHRILSRTRLKGFDSVYLGPGSEMVFELANRYEDRRAKIVPYFSYRVVVFNHTEGASYRLTYTRNDTPGVTWTDFDARSAQVATPATGSVAEPRLMVLNAGAWRPYTEDWALYDGYITETGRTTVEMRVHTPSEVVTPGQPKRFDQFYFSGADPDMSITLDKTCTVRPRFTSSPGFGSWLGFEDVAQHRVRQIVFLEALQHLFNLRFYTEEASRTVYIETADDFYNRQNVADWRTKTDFTQPVVMADIAPEIHESRTWGYREGDGAVARFNATAVVPLGDWTAATESYAAKEGNEELRNPLFCPTLNSQGHYGNAPSALIMQVGDRDAEKEDGSNFTPRIVRYCGMHPLPAGERWGYPANQSSYPLAAFHYAGDDNREGFTLCFENRNGKEGLHRYYDRQAVRESTRQHITLALRIAPCEYESLFVPGPGAPGIRSVFRLDTGAGEVRAVLRTLGEYDPETGTIHCTFTRLKED